MARLVGLGICSGGDLGIFIDDDEMEEGGEATDLQRRLGGFKSGRGHRGGKWENPLPVTNWTRNFDFAAKRSVAGLSDMFAHSEYCFV